MQIKETVYNGHDNTIELRLMVDNVTITHTGISRVQVVVGATTLDSLTAPTLFDTSQADRLILKLGLLEITAGDYNARLIIFDNTHTHGLVWGDFAIKVI